MRYAAPITRLVKALAGLPGIGEKTAGRLALYVLNAKKEYIEELVKSITEVRDNVMLCSVCMGFSEKDPCAVCENASRDSSLVCVVGDYRDMVALEFSGSYKGLYHVLHGHLSPLKGIGPDELKVKELLKRVESNGIKEVIIATSFDGEGEATAMYLKMTLKHSGVKLTRIASGVPAGGYIEYMDPSTLLAALQGRKEV